MPQHCLVVRESSAQAQLSGDTASAIMEIRFDATLPEREVRAETVSSGVMTLTVSALHEAIRGRFEEQVLNRVFTEQFLRLRPTIVIVESVSGATLDLIRLARLFGTKVAVGVPGTERMPEPGSRGMVWLTSALASADALIDGVTDTSAMWVRQLPESPRKLLTPVQLPDWVESQRTGSVGSGAAKSFDYGLYEFGLRDHGLLKRMQQDEVAFFDGCGKVLDLACGAGIFLDLLADAGIIAEGVERNSSVVRYARDLGFRVHEADAFDFLRRAATDGKGYDGIHCAHFVEHLPVEAVEELIGLLYGALDEGGVLLLVFPNPESLRSQLLGFWRDPEHVRFYHADLVELMARAAGFEPVYNNLRSVDQTISPFTFQMPAWPGLPAQAPDTPGVQQPKERLSWWRRLLCPAAARLADLEQDNAALLTRITALEARSQASEQTARTLWAVNQTWAWDDDVTLCLRKPRSNEEGS